jgi:hypothetical protein
MTRSGTERIGVGHVGNSRDSCDAYSKFSNPRFAFLDARLTRNAHCRILPLCFLLDGRTCKWLRPSFNSIGWEMRSPTPRQQAQLPAEQPASRRSLGGLVSHPCKALCRTHLFTIEHSQTRAHPTRPASAYPSRPPSTHPAHQHREHSPSPAPSSPSSRFAQPHAQQHRQGIAPQPMRSKAIRKPLVILTYLNVP